VNVVISNSRLVHSAVVPDGYTSN